MNALPQAAHTTPLALPKQIHSWEFAENRERYIAHSILVGLVRKPELPSLAEARDIIKWNKQNKEI